MSKFNSGTATAAGSSPLTASAQPGGVTHEGGTGYKRSPRSELFLRATTMFAGEDSFYEKGAAADHRLRELTAALAVTPDGHEWLRGFLPWLRLEANIRTAAILIAAEAVHARLSAGIKGGNRQLIASVLHRADEPGEMIACWTSLWGRALPQPVKRGIADMLPVLYTPYALLKYDTASHGYRFGDVIELVHPQPLAGTWLGRDAGGSLDRLSAEEIAEKAAWYGQRLGDLFEYAIDRRHGRDNPVPASLRMIRANEALRECAEIGDYAALLDQGTLREAGMTWEDALSLAGPHVSKKDLWTALLPSLGYMALIRNLRNIDQAGVTDTAIASAVARIADPAEVARSRQLPFRFLSAYLNAPSLRWGHALETALDHSLHNIPEIPGRTLILIDTSGSMEMAMSGRSQMTRVQAAAVFALALAIRNPAGADVWGFADGQFHVDGIRPGLSVLKAVEAFRREIGRAGHGTRIGDAVAATYKAHDRVIIFTDMQTFPRIGHDERYLARYGLGYASQGDAAASVPKHVPVYGFNLAGYTRTALSGEGNRHELGGLTDHTFKLIPMIEAGQAGRWPWAASTHLQEAAA